VALYYGLHMTNIGTKNGSVIVKNGSAAENCNCCGGWYCYLDDSQTDSQYAMKSLASATVTISSQNYIKWAKNTWFYGTEYTSEGFAGAQYNGTYSLQKSSDGTTWRHDFAAQPDATCVAYLLLYVTGTAWVLRFAYSKMMYSAFTTETYKELSEMQCRDNYGYGSGFQFSGGPTRYYDIVGTLDQCHRMTGVPASSSFVAFQPNASSADGSIVRQEGSLQVAISFQASY
jgi:hypothetical protein